MDVKYARRTEGSVGITCVYWLNGKCNRNPCRFLHSKTPSPHTAYKCGKNAGSSSQDTFKYNTKAALVTKSEDGRHVIKASKKSSSHAAYKCGKNVGSSSQDTSKYNTNVALVTKSEDGTH
ncbi:hypothetical protein CR513_39286, partial [Mucuna pruriens]